MGPKLDKLIPILQITFDPYHSSILNTIVLQYLTQYFMINSMKHLKKMPNVVSFLLIAEDILLSSQLKLMQIIEAKLFWVYS